MPPKDKYTDPDLREQVKEEVKEGDKGGAPGQWSARKAQMMASEYKKRGGGYTTDKKDQDPSQKSLTRWTEEEWQTKEGEGQADRGDGVRKRYLPKKAWEGLSEEEKQRTEEVKIRGGKEGKQFVENTGGAKDSRKKVNEETGKKLEKRKRGEKSAGEESEVEAEEQNEGNDAASAEEHEEPAKKEETKSTPRRSTRGQKRAEPASETKSASPEAKKQKSNTGAAKETKATPKKESATKSTKSTPKKEATKSSPSKQLPAKDIKSTPTPKKGSSSNSSKDPPAGTKPGSKDRLPKKGQEVSWRSLPGFVSGEVVEIVYEEKEVEGKKVKGSKEDPRVVLRSGSSGKVAVHKGEAVYF